MDQAVLQQRLMSGLKAHKPGKKEQGMLLTQAAVQKMINLWLGWDTRPGSLDTSAFTLEELETALLDLGEHHEGEGLPCMQKGNATSAIITAGSLVKLLPELPRVEKPVSYF